MKIEIEFIKIENKSDEDLKKELFTNFYKSLDRDMRYKLITAINSYGNSLKHLNYHYMDDEIELLKKLDKHNGYDTIYANKHNGVNIVYAVYYGTKSKEFNYNDEYVKYEDDYTISSISKYKLNQLLDSKDTIKDVVEALIDLDELFSEMLLDRNILNTFLETLKIYNRDIININIINNNQ